MNVQIERRANIRQIGDGLVVVINGKGNSLVNISVDGVCFQSHKLEIGDTIQAKIARLVDLSDCVDTQLTVVNVRGSVVHAKFYNTMTLMRYIISHISEITGVKSSYFK